MVNHFFGASKIWAFVAVITHFSFVPQPESHVKITPSYHLIVLSKLSDTVVAVSADEKG